MTPSEPSTPSDLRARALGHLRDLTGNPSADFHPGQFEAVSALVEGHRRALVVQRTGWGKSAVYFLSALLMRAQGYGPTLIISPLLALMRDQVSAAQRAGVRAAAISSANPTEWAEISSALDRGEVDVLLVSPERLNNPRFRDEQLPQLMDRLGLLVVDEAHCISDWGHDFRPDYRRIKDMLAQLPDSVAVLATTATANERVIEDVREQLGVGSGYGGEVFTLRGPLSRASLRLGVLRLPSTSARLAWLLAHLDELPGSGIIYALTIGAAEDTAQALTDAGHRVAAYTGRTDAAEREDLEAALKDNQVKALVATSALGMGFDKPDLGFVVHLGAPSSPVAYYQQVGVPGAPRTPRTSCCSRARGPGHLGVLRHRVHAHRGEGHRRPHRTCGARRAAVRRGAGAPRQHQALAAGAAAQGARRGRSRGTRGRGMAEHRQAVALRRSAVRPCGPRQGGRAAGHAGLPGHGRVPHAVPHAPARRPLGGTVRAVRRVRGAVVPHRRRSRGLLRGGCRPAPRRCPPRAARPVAHGNGASRHPCEGQDPGDGARGARSRRGAPHRSRLGARLREIFRADANGQPVDSQVTADLGRAALTVLSQWDWQQRPTAVVAMPSQSRPQLVDSLARGIASAGHLPFWARWS